MRNADLIVMVIEKAEQLDVLEKELYHAGFRLNKKPPNVLITKTHSGGIKVESTVRLRHVDSKMVKIVLNERGIHNAEVLIRENVSIDRLIDSVSKNRVYVPSIIAYNKTDLLTGERKKNIPKEFLQISSKDGTGLDRLKSMIWKNLGLMRIYMKKAGKEPDMEEPLIMKKGSSVEDVAERIHREFSRKLEYAKIWGPSAKFGGQKVGVTKKVQDRDVGDGHMQ